MDDFAERHVNIEMSLERVIHEIPSCPIRSSSLERSWDKGLVQCSIRYDFRGEKQRLCEPGGPADSENVGVSGV